MSDNLDHVRKKISDLIEQAIDELDELEEMSSTGNVAGYLVPMAFGGHTNTHKKKVRHTTDRLGYSITKRGEDELNRKPDSKKGDPTPKKNPKFPKKLEESRSRYHDFKMNQEMTAKQKIGKSINKAKKALREVNRDLKMIKRYKTEIGYSQDNYWKGTVRDIYKIEEMLHRISHHLRELKS